MGCCVFCAAIMSSYTYNTGLQQCMEGMGAAIELTRLLSDQYGIIM